MTREEINTKLKALITCMKCEVSGKPCDDNCPTQYEAGNMGEIIENLEAISKLLEQEPETVTEFADRCRECGAKYGKLLKWMQEPCEDAISRQAVKDMLDARGVKAVMTFEHFKELLDKLPSVTLQPKTGHWIEQIDHEENCRTLICSNCDRPALHDEDSIWKHKFCPHCGAKMVEPQESEDKENE